MPIFILNKAFIMRKITIISICLLSIVTGCQKKMETKCIDCKPCYECTLYTVFTPFNPYRDNFKINDQQGVEICFDKETPINEVEYEGNVLPEEYIGQDTLIFNGKKIPLFEGKVYVKQTVTNCKLK